MARRTEPETRLSDTHSQGCNAALKPRPRNFLSTHFDRFACAVTRLAGSPTAFTCAVLMVLGWALMGPVFGFSENWQLVINTGTTIVTFLMVFLIQQSQNKDSVALHLKLDELLKANADASNQMIGVEALDEDELRKLAEFYTRLARDAENRGQRARVAQKSPRMDKTRNQH